MAFDYDVASHTVVQSLCYGAVSLAVSRFDPVTMRSNIDVFNQLLHAM